MEPLFTIQLSDGQLWDYFEDVYGRVRPFAKLLYHPIDEEASWPMSLEDYCEPWP